MSNKRRRRLFGKRVVRLRRRENMSRGRLAAATGVSRPVVVWMVEHGRIDVSFDLACRIAEALEVPVKDLFEF